MKKISYLLVLFAVLICVNLYASNDRGQPEGCETSYYQENLVEDAQIANKRAVAQSLLAETYRFPAEFEKHEAIWLAWPTYENKAGLSTIAFPDWVPYKNGTKPSRF